VCKLRVAMELLQASLDDSDALIPLIAAWKPSLPEGPRGEAWLDAIANVAVDPKVTNLSQIIIYALHALIFSWVCTVRWCFP